MKQRGILFSIIFIVVLIFVYMQPVIFPGSSFSRPQVENRVKSPSSLNYEPIEAQGLAQEIGQPLAQFEEKYGKPVNTIASGFSFEINAYTFLNDSQYLEVNTDGKTVHSIKMIGGNKENNAAPFYIGMNMNELAALTMIFPNFTLEQDGAFVSFELTEEDMNYRPLVAFDNGTFAILFFDQETSQLFAIDYLDQATLLKLGPYQLTEGHYPLFRETENADWIKIDAEKTNWSFSIMEILRQSSKLASYHLDMAFQQETREVLTRFLSDTPDYLTSERVYQYQKSLTEERIHHFVLNTEEWAEVLGDQKLATESAIFESPVYDPTFTILSWHSDPFFHARFLHAHSETLGIAFSKQNMVVLLQERQNEKTKESDTK